MSEIRVDNITDEAGTGSPDFPNGILKSSLPAGSVIQVVSATKTDTYSEVMGPRPNDTSDIPGLTPSITPLSAGNKIFVSGVCTFTISNDIPSLSIFRDGNKVFAGDPSGNRQLGLAAQLRSSDSDAAVTVGFSFVLDANSTNSTTFSLRVINTSGKDQTAYINRSNDEADSPGIIRAASSITLMEIAG